MKLDYYSPTFRNVLLREHVEEKTKGGVYKPSTAFLLMEDRMFQVVKTGKDCIEVQRGDWVKVTDGIRLVELRLTVGNDFAADFGVDKDEELRPDHEFTFYQVMEQQIIGKFRRDDKTSKAKV